MTVVYKQIIRYIRRETYIYLLDVFVLNAITQKSVLLRGNPQPVVTVGCHGTDRLAPNRLAQLIVLPKAIQIVIDYLVTFIDGTYPNVASRVIIDHRRLYDILPVQRLFLYPIAIGVPICRQVDIILVSLEYPDDAFLPQGAV